MVKVKDLEKIMEIFFQKNREKGKAFVAKQFMEWGLPRSTAYDKIVKLENGSLKRKVGSGRIAKVATKENIPKIAAFFENKSGCSQKKVAQVFNCSQTRISQVLKTMTNIRTFKKSNYPDHSHQQKKAMRPKCRKLYENYKNLDFVMDDESYFTLNNSTLAGNDRFYAADPSQCSDQVRYNLRKKYEDKLLVSCCISPRGISPLYIHHSKQAINQYTYKEILEKTLLPLVSEYYKKDNEFIFWPDLARSHYAKSVIDFLKLKKIKVVPKDINPANVPEARPIENFWGDLKRLVYENNWRAENLEELEARIRYCYSKMNKEIFLTQIKHLSKKLYNIAKYGI